MHRPSDQAKLLFFALLRSTVSALATTDAKVAAAAATQVARPTPTNFATPPSSSSTLLQSSNIQLRLARRTDVPSIQRCNLATLPENYNSQFYVNHLRQWPDLCLVAEDVYTPSEAEQQQQQGNHHQRGNEYHNDFRRNGSSFSTSAWSFGRGGGGNDNYGNKPEPNIVAYVLGKVEMKQPPPPAQSLMYSFNDGGDPTWDTRHNVDPEEGHLIGHVTSLAVLQPYRRKGLAAELMKQLHYHMEEAYGASSVGLHVRKSNVAACRLYQEYGYEIDLNIPGYYQDGEDAYFMKKRLQQPQGVMVRPGFTFLGRRPRAWEAGPVDLRLPRGIKSPQSQEQQYYDPNNSDQNPELLTGSY